MHHVKKLKYKFLLPTDVKFFSMFRQNMIVISTSDPLAQNELIEFRSYTGKGEFDHKYSNDLIISGIGDANFWAINLPIGTTGIEIKLSQIDNSERIKVQVRSYIWFFLISILSQIYRVATGVINKAEFKDKIIRLVASREHVRKPYAKYERLFWQKNTEKKSERYWRNKRQRSEVSIQCINWSDVNNQMPFDSNSEYLVLKNEEDILFDYSLDLFCSAISQFDNGKLFYADHLLIDENGRDVDVILKGAWDRVLQEDAGYVGSTIIIHHSLISKENIVGQKPEAIAKTILKMAKTLPNPDQEIIHIPQVCFKSRIGLLKKSIHAANQRGFCPHISIIIPTKDKPELIGAILDGLSKTDYPSFETIIIDNGTTDKSALAMIENYCTQTGARWIKDNRPFNFSRLMNQGILASSGDFVLSLNNDIVVSDADWLRAIVSIAKEPSVGIVGTKLLYPNGLVQHAGMAFGEKVGFYHLHLLNQPQTCDLFGFGERARRVTAVTGACMLIRRSVFDTVGMFDETAFPVSYNDVDLCLRAHFAGFEVIYSPEVSSVHLESVSRGLDTRKDNRDRAKKERENFNLRWGDNFGKDLFLPQCYTSGYHPALDWGKKPVIGRSTNIVKAD